MQDTRDRSFPSESSSGLPLELLRDRAIYAVKIFLFVYLPFTSLQTIGIIFSKSSQIANVRYSVYSVMTNLVMSSVAATFLLVNMISRKRGSPPKNLFYLSLVGTVLIIAAGLLLHIHFAGSQSSILLLLFLITIIIFSWFLRWRDSLIILVVGNLGIFTLVLLEYLEILPYSPLLKQTELLRSIFMDWRVITINFLIYMTTMTIAVVVLVGIRRTLSNYSLKMAEANRTLQIEVAERKIAEQEKEEVIKQLQQALVHVRTLKELLPICSSCKKIRDDQGYWNQLEQYFRTHSDVKFTHSLCPDCAEELYPDLTEEQPGKSE